MDDRSERQVALGRRISEARLRRGMTQEDLGTLIGTDKTAISKIEKGVRKVDSYELALISDELGVPVRSLLGEVRSSDTLAVAARVLEGATGEDVSQAANRARQLLELEHLIDQLGVPSPVKPPALEVDPPKEVNPRKAGKLLAGRVREAVVCGDDPIADLVDFSEQVCGLGVAFEPLGDEVAVSGLCVRSERLSVAMVNSSRVLGHTRFTLAHELCHFLLRDAQPMVIDRDSLDTSTAEEVRANSFAAHLLMPAEGVSRFLDVRGLSEQSITEMLFVYGVSLMALTWHLEELGIMSWSESAPLRDLGPKALAIRHGRLDAWTRAEADRGVRQLPTQLHERVLAAYQGGYVGIGVVAGALGRDDEDTLVRELTEAGVAPRLDQGDRLAQVL